MKLFTALAALTLIAAPVQANSNQIKSLLQVSSDHLRNGEYGLACLASNQAYEETVKAKYSAKLQGQMKSQANKVCALSKEKETLTQTINNPIKEACSAKWGTDYVMVKHCFDQQTKAKASLGI
jgi:uncharacterized protein (UPF0335 family)